ncbi:hypothetical protein E4U53_003272 [Claviceps sorghi]|nr:hypothetical protein E4U53_003272 [Claviceps sorghi]
MSCRHVLLSAVLVATAILTLPLCLPYLASATSWRLSTGTPADAAHRRPRADPVRLLDSLPREYPWAKAWHRHAKHLARTDRWTVCYGHDAKRGFVERPYAVGLDSACATGGVLTALVVEAGPGTQRAPFKYTVVQVPCKRHA